MKKSTSKTVIILYFLLLSFSIQAQQLNIITVAGNGDGLYDRDNVQATSTSLWHPADIVLDNDGNLYIADEFNHRIRKVSPAGIITTIAGTGNIGFGGDNGPAVAANLSYPSGITIDGSGNLYIADRGNRRVRKINTAGIITTIAGNGTNGFSGDNGPAIAAQLNNLKGIAVDGSGNLYIADSGNHRIRKVNSAGTITTIAGTGVLGFNEDNILANSSQLNFPISVAVDNSGNLYIADINNNRIRKVNSTGIITTIAGIGEDGFSGDNGQATAAKLNAPTWVTFDKNGNLYINDQQNHRIRKVDPTGIITTIAGAGSPGFSGDNGPAISAKFRFPLGMNTDAAGNLYIADTDNFRIRKLIPGKTSQTITFGTLEQKTFGDIPFNLIGTASSGLAVSYTSSNPNVATITGNTVTIIGAGSTIITASQTGNESFNAAPEVSRTLTVDKANQGITFNALEQRTFGSASFNLTATASSGLAVSYTSSNTSVATVTGNTVTIIGAGSTTITASQTGNTNFNPASDINQPLVVLKANQTITFNTLEQKVLGDAPFNLTAIASSGLAVSYVSSNPNVATIAGNIVTITGIGTTTITASQAGNTNFNPASDINQSLTIASSPIIKTDQTITFVALEQKTLGDPPFNLTATASSGLAVSYTSSNPNVATITGSTVTITGVGITTITASQAGNTSFNPAPDIIQTLTVKEVEVPLSIFNPTTRNETLLAFPNPVVDNNLKISFIAVKNANIKIEVYNSNGDRQQSLEMFAKIGENKLEITTDLLPPGVYMIYVFTEGQSLTKRFIKN